MQANELRHGGDIQGLLSGNYRTLDYLQGAGYGAIYLAGTPFINMVCSTPSPRGRAKLISHGTLPAMGL